MLPALVPENSLKLRYSAFLARLTERGFRGDIETSYGARMAVATDNSIYQTLPQAVIFPKDNIDCQQIGRLAAEFTDVSFSPRGGGTGTNGQSLTDGIVIDIRRYLNQVLEVNIEQGWVKVQAGLVKDALNDYLRPFGFFFAPDLSTSNRATIGGMISTDASGQGSLVYGKTSDHVLGLTAVLADGELLKTCPVPLSHAKYLAQLHNGQARIYQQAIDTAVPNRQAILDKFPRLNRFLTGYDLEHVYNEAEQTIDIGRLITGAEGTLAMVTEAKLSITPIAKYKALINIKYDSFDAALRHAPALVQAQATSVETIDSNVLNLAKTDIIWHSISDLITDVPNQTLLGLNMVEYNSESSAQMTQHIAHLEQQLTEAAEQGKNGVIGYQICYDKADIQRIYAMRKKAVGLLGKTAGERKPVAFAEDTAVPPEKLADFIAEFRGLLDSHDLQYGMFGHVDAGVLHVRPALNLLDPEQESLMHQLSDQVVALVTKYNGLMWGEHGKGYRSEYAPAFFGDQLFSELRKIKRAFDPFNQMNPGKICTPLDSDAQLVSVKAPKRATLDRSIPIVFQREMAPAMSCNGNGLCFNYDVTSPMCPSSKITGDRRHTPKGRAGLIREWLRLLAQHKLPIHSLTAESLPSSFWQRFRNTYLRQQSDFSHEVLEVMNGCLACKSCTSQCPVNVDVPDFRAKFLSLYYRRYQRPIKDLLVASVEATTPWLAKAPKLVNRLLKMKPVSWLLEHHVGYVDTPMLSSPTLAQRLKNKIMTFDLAQLQAMSAAQRQQVIAIVQDPFTSFYDAPVVESLAKVINALGYQAVLLPFHPNGKPAHVKGFLRQFNQQASTTAQFLNQLAKLNITLIGADTSLVLCYRDEYNKALGQNRGEFHVNTCHEWLETVPKSQWHNVPTNRNKPSGHYSLLAHCTEKTALPNTEKSWQDIFAHLDLELSIHKAGCCGMAGTYGHEKSQLHNSKGIYQLSWQPIFAQQEVEQVLTTGFSCRSQVARFEGKKPMHPIQVLAQLLCEPIDTDQSDA